jgi:hypothetical protein
MPSVISMTYEEILRALAALPPEGRQQAAEFIASLQEQYAGSSAGSENGHLDLGSFAFVGMWHDREDMQDSNRWLRRHRESEW